MTNKTSIRTRTRRRVQAFSILAVLLLSLTLAACGDKVEPTSQFQIAEARAVVDRERSQRLLAEERLNGALWLAVLGSGSALIIGLAIGSGRKTGGAGSDAN